jgi:NADPH:quinone reductase-like Zn-dependent oxidoreductase
MVVRGVLRPVVSQSLPLEQAAAAFDLLSSRSVLGRLVLLPG